MADARFPRYPLDAAIEVARQIHERGAGGVASNDELAIFLGYKSKSNGAYLYRVSAARLFGLIDGQGQTLRITPLALDIIRPAFPESAQNARLHAFENVPLFHAFLEQFGGKDLSSDTMMHNALNRLGVSGKDAPEAWKRLVESADQAGLFKVAGKRTRMIRPTIADARVVAPQTIPSEEAFGTATIRQVQRDEPRFPTLIAGALESLPTERQWDEDEFQEWLDLFERALRVHYRLPRRGRYVEGEARLGR